MIKLIASIAADLRKCNGKCRKCRWRDGFSGECMLNHNAAEYIEALEADNAKQMVYCKDCVFCEKKSPDRAWQYEEYKCMHKDGLTPLSGVKPMDYCSIGRRKDG